MLVAYYFGWREYALLFIIASGIIFYFLFLGLLDYVTASIQESINVAHLELQKYIILNPDDMPDECIRINKWSNDAVIDAYFSRIEGRNPVQGEYCAAEVWWEQRKVREKKENKIAHAKKVCANFQKRIGTTV